MPKNRRKNNTAITHCIYSRYGPGGVNSAVFYDHLSISVDQPQPHGGPAPPPAGPTPPPLSPPDGCQSRLTVGILDTSCQPPSEHSNSSASAGSTNSSGWGTSGVNGGASAGDPGEFWNTGWPPTTNQQHSPLAESGTFSKAHVLFQRGTYKEL